MASANGLSQPFRPNTNVSPLCDVHLDVETFSSSRATAFTYVMACGQTFIGILSSLYSMVYLWIRPPTKLPANPNCCHQRNDSLSPQVEISSFVSKWVDSQRSFPVYEPLIHFEDEAQNIKTPASTKAKRPKLAPRISRMRQSLSHIDPFACIKSMPNIRAVASSHMRTCSLHERGHDDPPSKNSLVVARPRRHSAPSNLNVLHFPSPVIKFKSFATHSRTSSFTSSLDTWSIATPVDDGDQDAQEVKETLDFVDQLMKEEELLAAKRKEQRKGFRKSVKRKLSAVKLKSTRE